MRTFFYIFLILSLAVSLSSCHKRSRLSVIDDLQFQDDRNDNKEDDDGEESPDNLVSPFPDYPPSRYFYSEWTRLFGYEERATDVNALTIDSYGDVYVTGSIGGGNAWEAFLVKYDHEGDKLWKVVPQAPGASFLGTHSESVAVDSLGNVYISGWTSGDLDGEKFTDSVGTVFISKYNTNGVRQWTRILNSGCYTINASVAVSPEDEIYMTAHSYGVSCIINGEEGVGAFLVKYTPNGQNVWTVNLGGESSVNVDTDKDGNVYVSGGKLTRKFNKYGQEIWSSSEIDGGLLAVDSESNSYIGRGRTLTKLDSKGKIVWSRSLGSRISTNIRGVSLDALDNIYITGLTEESLNDVQKKGEMDVFVIKYSPDGEVLWTELVGGADNPVMVFDIVADPISNVFIAGQAFGAIDGKIPTEGAYRDAFIKKMRPEIKK